MIFGFIYNFVYNFLNYIGDQIKSKRNLVYFSKFLQLIFTHLCYNAQFDNDVQVPIFKLNKRYFSEIMSKDAEKAYLS